jgi:hypothetical protein
MNPALISERGSSEVSNAIDIAPHPEIALFRVARSLKTFQSGVLITLFSQQSMAKIDCTNSILKKERNAVVRSAREEALSAS